MTVTDPRADPGTRAATRAEPYELTRFPFGSAVLQPSHRTHLDQLARRILASWSTTRPVRAIRIVGHTDPVGTAQANMGLGHRRAEAVRRGLLTSLEQNHPGAGGRLRLQTTSRGELDQIPGPPALNRRVQLFFFVAPGPVPTASPFTLPAAPGNGLRPARTAVRAEFVFPADRAIAEMVNLLATHGQRDDAVIYLANWHLEHDLAFPAGGTLASLLRSCSARDATIRALVWSGGIPRISLPRGVPAPLWVPADVWNTLWNWLVDHLDQIVRDTLSRFFGEPAVNRKAVDFINTLPGAAAILDDETLVLGSHHQKVLVVANTDQTAAIIGGVEWNSDRLRHVRPGTPLFDISVRLDGAAANDIAELFEQRWRAVAPPSVPIPARPPAAARPGGTAAGGATVQVGVNYGCGRPLRTIPRQLTGASDLIENILSNCRRFFYLECQYGIGNEPLASSIRRAFANGAEFGIVVLAAREVVSDFPEVAFWRHQFWRSFPQADRNLLVFERLDDAGGTAGPHAYVHSKLALVDDQAASVGTLNLSRRSWRHDSEITAVITDAAERVRGFRLNLWPHHLTLGSGDDIANPAAAFALWQAVHAGRRPMPRLRPVRMLGPTPERWSDLLLKRVPFPVPARIKALAKVEIDTVLDRLHFEVFDPIGPPTCAPAAMASRPSVVPIRR